MSSVVPPSCTQPLPIQYSLPLHPHALVEDPPARRGDNLSPAAERHDRLTSCRFLRTLGTMLRLPRRVLATACLLFHRVFLLHSYRQWSLHEVVAACLMAAGKLEEVPRRVDELVQAYYPLLYPGLDCLSKESEQFRQLRARIIDIECLVLSAAGYRFHFKHPYEYVLGALQRMWLCFPTPSGPLQASQLRLAHWAGQAGATALEAAARNRELAMRQAELSWKLVDQSLNSRLCLEQPPQHVALAAILLAAAIEDRPLPPPELFVLPELAVLEDSREEPVPELRRLLPGLPWFQWFAPRLEARTLRRLALQIWQNTDEESPLLRRITAAVQLRAPPPPAKPGQAPAQQFQQQQAAAATGLRQLLDKLLDPELRESQLQEEPPEPEATVRLLERLVCPEAVPWRQVLSGSSPAAPLKQQQQH